MHGNYAICVRYTGLGAVVGVVECFARGGAKLGQDEALSGSVALNAVDGGITGLNDQQRLPVVRMRNGEGFCGRGRIPNIALLLRLCAVEENLIQAVGARRERRGQHRFAAPLDGLLVNVRADDALGLGEIRLLASCVPRTEEIARQ